MLANSAQSPHRRATALLAPGLDFEGELVIADADVVTIVERDGTANPLVLHVNSVGRPGIEHHEIDAGIDDGGVVAADVGVVENDVVIANPSNARRGRPQRRARGPQRSGGSNLAQ